MLSRVSVGQWGCLMDSLVGRALKKREVRPRQVDVDFTDLGLTAFGGASILARTARDFGLFELLGEAVSVKDGSFARTRASDERCPRWSKVECSPNCSTEGLSGDRDNESAATSARNSVIIAEPSRAEPSRAEPSRAEPSRAPRAGVPPRGLTPWPGPPAGGAAPAPQPPRRAVSAVPRSFRPPWRCWAPSPCSPPPRGPRRRPRRRA